MTALIDSVSAAVPTALIELRRLGRTLKQRAVNILAYVDSTGPARPTGAQR